MCAIIDANCLPKVFDPTNSEHANFLPIWKWIHEGHGGRMIYGGSTYLRELRHLRRILKLVAELSRKSRVTVLPAITVDTIEQAIATQIGVSGQDEHLVAIVVVSGCRVVVTMDDDAIQLLKRQDLYQGRKVKPPKIYQRKRDHEHLCCEDNVVAIPVSEI
jgi:hypothetical protein